MSAMRDHNDTRAFDIAIGLLFAVFLFASALVTPALIDALGL